MRSRFRPLTNGSKINASNMAERVVTCTSFSREINPTTAITATTIWATEPALIDACRTSASSSITAAAGFTVSAGGSEKENTSGTRASTLALEETFAGLDSTDMAQLALYEGTIAGTVALKPGLLWMT